MYFEKGRPRVLDIVSFKDRPVETLLCITLRSLWGTWKSIWRINFEMILIERLETTVQTVLKTFRCRGGTSNGGTFNYNIYVVYIILYLLRNMFCYFWWGWNRVASSNNFHWLYVPRCKLYIEYCYSFYF